MGLVHSIDTFSTLDGPGIRTVIFLQGCHLRCKYCHNPDTWDIKSASAKEYTPEQLMEIIIRSKPYFKASGGGITFSGGEPLLQHRFVKEVFIRCNQSNIHTAFDSSLYISREKLLEVLPFTDLVLADIKHMDRQKSIELTGANNQLNIKNLKLINENCVPIWIRYVVVPGWTDSRDDVAEMARLVKDLDQVERIELLPYHSLGSHKWEMLGLHYELKYTELPDQLLMASLSRIVEDITKKRVIYR
jgi:pyruvate formate lyase activating enzyme